MGDYPDEIKKALAERGITINHQSDNHDTARIVYGARCTWWDSISFVGHTPTRGGHSLPCCPYCGSVLFEVPSLAEFLSGADRYETDGHPGYRKQLEWMRGKCFQDMAAAEAAYKAAPTPNEPSEKENEGG